MRAPNMQALTNDVRAEYPGVTIWGKGDLAHAERVSDHNEDDTAGVRAAQSDADVVPEHRAIDIKIDNFFTRANAYEVINEVLASSRLRARLWYINFENYQWSRSNGWVRVDNSDDPHPTHVHFSGLASADEDSSPWLMSGDDMEAFREEGIEYTDTRVRGFVNGDTVTTAVKPGNLGAGEEIKPNIWLQQIMNDVTELKARPPVQAAPADPATLKAVLLDSEVLAAIAKAVNDDDHRRSAE